MGGSPELSSKQSVCLTSMRSRLKLSPRTSRSSLPYLNPANTWANTASAHEGEKERERRRGREGEGEKERGRRRGREKRGRVVTITWVHS